MIFESEEQLAAACAYWQRVLRIQDWKVHTKIVRASHWGDGKYRVGQIGFNEQTRSAKITLLDHVDYTGEYWEHDHEETLVHELLHIHLLGLNAVEDTPEAMAEEQAISALAEALVNLEREMEERAPRGEARLFDEAQAEAIRAAWQEGHGQSIGALASAWNCAPRTIRKVLTQTGAYAPARPR